jgi:hypothetical protein
VIRFPTQHPILSAAYPNTIMPIITPEATKYDNTSEKVRCRSMMCHILFGHTRIVEPHQHCCPHWNRIMHLSVSIEKIKNYSPKVLTRPRGSRKRDLHILDISSFRHSLPRYPHLFTTRRSAGYFQGLDLFVSLLLLYPGCCKCCR